MKKTGFALFSIIILCVSYIYLKSSDRKIKTSEQETSVNLTRDFLGNEIPETTQPVLVKSNSNIQNKAEKKINNISLEKCGSYLKEIDTNNFNTVLNEIIKKNNLLEPKLDMTEYQLQTKSNEEIVVQHIPSEEDRNIIRVFKMADDGFPDRIKEFPNANGEIKLRLQGALSLGALIKKIEKLKTKSKHQELMVEKSNNAITRVDFINGKNQLICEDQLCECHQF